MKKLFILACVAGFAMTACKKEYTCTCTTMDGSTEIASSSVTIEAKKSDAEASCSASEVTVGTLTTSCELE